MHRIKDIILKNKDVDFVVHTKNKKELDTLVDILDDMGYEYTINISSLRETIYSITKEEGYDLCIRISKSRGVAYNPSIEH